MYTLVKNFHKLEFGNLIPGLNDCLIKSETETNINVEFINFKIFWDNNSLKYTKLICDREYVNKYIKLNIAYNEDINNFITIINNNMYKELIEFIKDNYNTAKKNNDKHFMSDRKDSKLPITNFFINNTKILDILININTDLQFINKVVKKDIDFYEIDIINDIYFKNNLMMFVKNNGKLYYIDKITIKLNSDKLTLLGDSINNVEVSKEAIINAYMCVFVNNLNNEIKNMNIDKKYINKIMEKYKNKYMYNQFLINMLNDNVKLNNISNRYIYVVYR